ncbi:hypothetical protein JRQ81_017589 [Phrynocephalus forsythii]|uniref:Uncharacterized protein n=1 Tax=Phrynocephalus forsythii TaxID=171643 RepID=A0A9Q1AZR5_9SAUR|nr:hypothetical protein JRQ81_017589 [Phrynocephalus forsythii]
MVKPRSHSVDATIASFKVSNQIKKKCKPFTEGEFVKGGFLETTDNLFEGFKNTKEIIGPILDVQLSRNSIMRRIEKMSQDTNEQLFKDVSNGVAFSL